MALRRSASGSSITAGCAGAANAEDDDDDEEDAPVDVVFFVCDIGSKPPFEVELCRCV